MPLKDKDRALKNMKDQNAHLNECCINYQEEAAAAKNSLRTTKGVVTKLKKRAGEGG